MKKITNIFFVLTLLLGGLSLASCDEYPFLSGGEDTEQENNNDSITTEKAVLFASVSEILADGKDEVMFYVKVGDVDVTDSVCFYVDDELMEANRFSTNNAGSYKFYAVYKGEVTNNVEVTASPVVQTAILCASASIMVADGEDELVLSVMVGDVNVTDSAYLYVDNKRMSSNRFTTTKAGSYKFFASYKGKITNNIIITAADPALYVELPEDTLADKFDGFHHNVLMTQATGTWCGYCPYMIRSIELFRENGSNAANTVVVATHGSDEFSCKASEAVVSALHVQGFPSSFFNLNPEAIVENNDPNINAEVINASAGMELKEKANVGIAATVATNNSKSVIAVRAAVKVGKTGAYRINAWLVEDKLPAYQSSNWYEFSNGMSTVLIEHDFVLRGASCLSPIQGELLGGKSSCEQGETIEYYYEFDADDADFVDVANCKVVVLVSAASGKNFYVNNVIECPVGKSVPFAYN